MKDFKVSIGAESAVADPNSSTGAFAQYVERQAYRMEQSGWADGAKNLRRWLIELRSGSVEANYRVQDPLLPRS